MRTLSLVIMQFAVVIASLFFETPLGKVPPLMKGKIGLYEEKRARYRVISRKVSSRERA